MLLLSEIKKLPFVDAVLNAGGEIFSVGGAVRDYLMGKNPKDLDLVVRKLPAQQLMDILAVYGSVKEQMVGGTFAMIKFTAKGRKDEIDIALPRTERKTGQGYQGFQVDADPNLTIEQDLERRDFTINSIAMDMNGHFIDPFGGGKDLMAQRIKMTNAEAFKDDPLRMLRAVQFAARFDFHIEESTFDAIQQNAQAIKEISAERIILEFQKIVTKGKPATGALFLYKTGLFKEIFGYGGQQYDGLNVEKSITMAEFIFTMLHTYTNHPSNVWVGTLKGDRATATIMSAFEIAKNNTPTTLAESRMLVHRIFKRSPIALSSFVVRETFGLGEVVEQMYEKNLPLGYEYLNLDGNHLMELGLVGKEIGQAQADILAAIYADELNNDWVELTNYIKAQKAVTFCKEKYQPFGLASSEHIRLSDVAELITMLTGRTVTKDQLNRYTQ